MYRACGEVIGAERIKHAGNGFVVTDRIAFRVVQLQKASPGGAQGVTVLVVHGAQTRREGAMGLQRAAIRKRRRTTSSREGEEKRRMRKGRERKKEKERRRNLPITRSQARIGLSNQPRQRKGTGHARYSLSGRAARVPSRTRDEMRIRICAEQVRPGYSKTHIVALGRDACTIQRRKTE
jgi:hypothetical protein